MANDYGTGPQQSGFKTIWEALRGMNEGRLATNEEFNRTGGRNIDVLKNRANVGTPPFVPPGQQVPPWHPPMQIPSPMDTLTAQQGPSGPPAPQVPQSAPVPSAGASSNVAATGPGSAVSPPAGGGKEGVPEPADPNSEYASIHDELGPEALAQIMGMGGLEEQLATAQALRDKESPQGRYVSNGRVYVPSGVFEHAMTGYQKYRGKKDVKRIQGEQAEGRTKMWDLLRRKGIAPPEDPGVGRVV